MNVPLLVVHVLTCLVAVTFNFANGQTCCENCCDVTCNAPTPFNITLDEIASEQPIYINIFPADPAFAGVDTVAFTYVSLSDGTYLLTVSEVYSNGYNTSEALINSQYDLGVFSFGSGTCSGQFTIFDYLETCDCCLYLAYLCYSSDPCLLEPYSAIPVFGLSTSGQAVSQNCLSSAMDLISRNGVPDQDYFIAPLQMSCNIVTNCNCTNNSIC